MTPDYGALWLHYIHFDILVLDSSVDFGGDPGSLTGLSHLVIPHCPLPSILLMPWLTSAALEPINTLRVGTSAQYHTLAVSSLGGLGLLRSSLDNQGGRLPYKIIVTTIFQISDAFCLWNTEWIQASRHVIINEQHESEIVIWLSCSSTLHARWRSNVGRFHSNG